MAAEMQNNNRVMKIVPQRGGVISSDRMSDSQHSSAIGKWLQTAA